MGYMHPIHGWITIWFFNIAMENSPIFKNGKPSISMGHLAHGYVSHNQMVWYPAISIHVGLLVFVGPKKFSRSGFSSIIPVWSLWFKLYYIIVLYDLNRRFSWFEWLRSWFDIYIYSCYVYIHISYIIYIYIIYIIYISYISYIYIVGGFNDLEKYESPWEGLSLFYYGK